MIPAEELQQLTPSTVIELCELDLTPVNQGIWRFFGDTNPVKSNLVWAGNVYTAYPIEMSGFRADSQGTLPTPNLKVANINGSISALCIQYDNLLGFTFTRRRTLLKYLDAVNFPNGNPTADPTQEFTPDIYHIERKASETNTAVEFELATAIDVDGVQLPRRQIIANMCHWVYRGDGCGYAGAAMFDNNDQPTADATKDSCSHRLTGCRVRFGTNTDLPFGGFPGAIVNMPMTGASS